MGHKLTDKDIEKAEALERFAQHIREAEFQKLAKLMQEQIDRMHKLMQDCSDFPVQYEPVEFHTTSPKDFDNYCYANEHREDFETASYVDADNEIVFVGKIRRA